MVPLTLRGRALSVLVFSAPPSGDLEALAARGAAALELAERYTDVLASARRHRACSAAAELQQDLMPPRIARLEGAEVAGSILPAYDVGGDWIDHCAMADGGWLGVADAVGKGPQASAIGAIALGAYRATRRGGGDLADAAATSTTRLRALEVPEIFMSAVLASVGRPVLVAGVAALRAPAADGLARRSAGCARSRAATARSSGSTASTRRARPRRATIAPDELVVLVSDGVLERTAPGGEPFGEDGLRRALEAMGGAVGHRGGVGGARGRRRDLRRPAARRRQRARARALLSGRAAGPAARRRAVVAGMELDRRAFVGLGLAALPALAGWRAPAGREPLALATADTEAHVVVVGLDRAARCSGGWPRSRIRAASRAGRAGTSSWPTRRPARVSLLTMRPARVRRVLRGLGAPRYTAIAARRTPTPSSATARAASSWSWTCARGRIVAGVEVGAGARHLSLDPAGRDAVGRAGVERRGHRGRRRRRSAAPARAPSRAPALPGPRRRLLPQRPARVGHGRARAPPGGAAGRRAGAPCCSAPTRRPST